MSAKIPASQGRRTPLSLNGQPKQQPNRRPSTSGNKFEQNRQPQQLQQQQQHHNSQQQQQQNTHQQSPQHLHSIKEDKNTTNGSMSTTKESQSTGAFNIGSNNNKIGSDALANGKNGTASTTTANAVNNAVAPQEQNIEKKETRNRAAKQQQQSIKVDEQEKNVAAKKENDAASKTAPSMRKQPVQQQQQQQQQPQPQQQVNERKISNVSAASVKKPVEEKSTTQTQVEKPIEEKTTSNKPATVNDKLSNDIIILDDDIQPPNEPNVAGVAVVENKLPASKMTPEKVAAKDVQQSQVQNDKGKQEKEKSNNSTKTVTPKKLAPSPPTKLKSTVTSCIDDGDNNMALTVKKRDEQLMAPPAILQENPNATSTPGKAIRTFDLKTPEQPIFRDHNLTISGRRSIRHMTDWTPTRFENDPLFRGSYRRIKTDLDTSLETNTSLNVTVGSEPDNNTSWFSFRSRKRERTPTNVETVKEAMLSPPKRGRFDGLFNVMASPLTALRSRFSKTSIQTNPVEKFSSEQGEDAIEADDDGNMSVDNNELESKVENIAAEGEHIDKKDNSLQNTKNICEENLKSASNEKIAIEGDEEDYMAEIAITETSLDSSTTTAATRRRCTVM